MIDFPVDAFLDDEFMGVDAVYISASGVSKSIRIILEMFYTDPSGGGIATVSDVSSFAICKASDVSDAARGDSLVVDTTTYFVTEVMPQWDGFTNLRISKE